MANVSVANSDAGLASKTLDLLESDQTITGLKTFSRGAASPFSVASGALVVANLDADKLDGVEAAAFLLKAGGTMVGNLLFTDNTYDIGAAGATRPRDVYISRNVLIGGTLGVTGAVTLSGIAQSILGGNIGSIAATNTLYSGFGFNSSATEADMLFPIPAAGTVKSLYAMANGAAGGSQSWVITVRKNGVDTALTCTMSDPAVTASDVTHSFTVVAGDQISIKTVASAGATTRKLAMTCLFVTT